MAKDPVAAATSGNDVSYARLLNPFSQLFGGGGDKYPEWMAKLFPGNPSAAWMVSKMGAIGGLALIATAAIRAGMHNNAIADTYEYDDPSRKLKSHLGTTFVAPLAPSKEALKKKASKVREDAVPLAPPTSMWTNTGRVAWPVLALIFGSTMGWRLADKWSDQKRNKELTEAVSQKSDLARRLMQTRARVAKGVATDKEVADVLAAAEAGEGYTKVASNRYTEPDTHPVIRTGVTGYGLLALALMMAGMGGAYKYFSAADPNNIKFKALKKGLRTYAREKTSMTPITNVPSDASEYFASIDEGGKDKNVREEPEKQAINRGVVISD